MENIPNDVYDLYKDIRQRTKGEIYLGVLGPVRTGKSTFIKRFMESCVFPFMEESYAKKVAMDELPQSAGGKTITTTEPKFIPKDAVKIKLKDDLEANIRLIDCVGYMVDGASGHMEEDTERMVKTPWFEEEIPFTMAAEIGTDKVMNEHATIGVIVLTDGSFGDLPRNSYIASEEKLMNSIKEVKKPFIVLLNSLRPYSKETLELAKELEEKYHTTVLPINCEQLKENDIHEILEKVLYEFPISVMEFFLPEWMEVLGEEDDIKGDIIRSVLETSSNYKVLKDCLLKPFTLSSDYISRIRMESLSLEDGCVKYYLEVEPKYYYEMLSRMLGQSIGNEYQLLNALKELSSIKKEYGKTKAALESVRNKGYGVVLPERGEIMLNQPEVIKHGNKYGVKMKASSPSLHLIKANIETEIAPIVGSKEQAEDLLTYIEENRSSEDGVWNTNIFGKSVEQLVKDGISAKITSLGEECQMKLQDTMQKVVNDSNGGMICIII